ncbi:hypothetical protein [Chlamydia sp.]|uniref:hypothetical protein n=1 Tax=Chlamydia sp. TaxID=35827 RepID=UPI0025BE36F4|nr:hypothetical protein [Chlamydia sp.]MBQ8498299.1 hypothetical protein [Chlamydia sp.]
MPISPTNLDNSRPASPQSPSTDERRFNTGSIESSLSNFDWESLLNRLASIARAFFSDPWKLLPFVGLIIAGKLIHDRATKKSNDQWELRFCLSMLGGSGVLVMALMATIALVVISCLFYLLGQGISCMVDRRRN